MNKALTKTFREFGKGLVAALFLVFLLVLIFIPIYFFSDSWFALSGMGVVMIIFFIDRYYLNKKELEINE